MINPRLGGPAVYRQLAGLLRDQIRAGTLSPGDRVPSETTLVQQYGVARGTARKAVAELRAEGLVVVRSGHGSYVREHPDAQNLTPTAGSTVTARMPTAEERNEHDIDEGVPVFEVIDPEGVAGVYPADRWQLRWPTA